MNEEKLKSARLAAIIFSGIGRDIKNVVTAKQTYKAELLKLDGQRDYSPEYIEAKRAELKATYAQARAAGHEKISKALGELQAVLEEKHSTLDLASPEWSNALGIINAVGAGMDFETARQINSAFAFDQPALKALAAIYAAKGIVADAGLDQQVYEIAPSFNQLQKTAEAVLLYNGGTIGELARAVGRIADLEGVTFEKSPDPDAFTEAAHIGAGMVAA